MEYVVGGSLISIAEKSSFQNYDLGSFYVVFITFRETEESDLEFNSFGIIRDL